MERTVTVVHEAGLHARPAATVVETAGEYDASVTVAPADERRAPAAATSMLALTALDVAAGATVRLVAEGPDAEPALDALEAVLSTAVDVAE